MGVTGERDAGAERARRVEAFGSVAEENGKSIRRRAVERAPDRIVVEGA